MIDWLILLEGTRNLCTGVDPYTGVFFSPPYVALFLASFAWLPETMAAIAYYVLALVSLAYICYKLEFSRWQVIAFASSPIMLHTLKDGNLEPFVLLGAFLPAWAGLPLLAMKPQVGGALILYILYERIKRRKGFTDFLPLAGLLAASFLICPTWLVSLLTATGTPWNWGFWPHSLAIGLPLLIYGIQKQDKLIALAASPFLGPYMTLQNLAAFLPLAAREAPLGLPLYFVAWLGYAILRT